MNTAIESFSPNTSTRSPWRSVIAVRLPLFVLGFTFGFPGPARGSIVILSVIILVGCGGGGDASPTNPSSPSPPPENEPPDASIVNPSDGSSFREGVKVTFEGSAEDPEDGELGGEALVWESDRDGEFGTGRTVTTAELSRGDHTVALTATDADGASDTSEISVAVSRAPSATILQPEKGATYGQNESITFKGSAKDPEEGELGGDALEWSSNRDGAIGMGRRLISPLSAGNHRISLVATDGHGLADTSRVSVTVEQVPESIDVRPRFLALTPDSTAVLTTEVTDVAGNPIADPDLTVLSRDSSVAAPSGKEVTARTDGVTDLVVKSGGEFVQPPVADSSRVAVVEADGFYAIVSSDRNSVATTAEPGATVALRLMIVPSPGDGGTIGSVEGSIGWDSTILSFADGGVSRDAKDRGWEVFENFNDASSGHATFSAFTSGSTSEALSLLDLTFTATGDSGTRAVIDLTISAAGDHEARDITDKVETVDSWARIE